MAVREFYKRQLDGEFLSDYVYKDNEATMPTLSAMLTSRIGDGSGDHEIAYLDAIKLLVAAFGSGSMIDIGCGRGRLVELALGRIREIVALEPDPGRCNWSRELFKDEDSVHVLNCMTSEYITDHPGKEFDLSVLGMVIQHLPTYKVTEIIDDVAALTRQGGMAVVSTTHAVERAKCFTYQHVAEARISEAEFNDYAANPHGQDKGLPVHRFSRAELESVVPDSLEVVHWGQFSYYRPEFLERFAAVHKVAPEEIANVGNSQFLVLKKR